jgi:hypothetical protein
MRLLHPMCESQHSLNEGGIEEGGCQPRVGRTPCVYMDKPKTFEVGLVLLIHAQDVDEVQRTLNDCFRSDLRVEAKEVGYCEERVGTYTFN